MTSERPRPAAAVNAWECENVQQEVIKNERKQSGETCWINPARSESVAALGAQIQICVCSAHIRSLEPLLFICSQSKFSPSLGRAKKAGREVRSWSGAGNLRELRRGSWELTCDHAGWRLSAFNVALRSSLFLCSRCSGTDLNMLFWKKKRNRFTNEIFL